MRSELLDKIYAASNDGLDIIIQYFPQAAGCDKPGKKFKMRTDERTASASLKKIKGVWRATDFGDEGTALTPIQICMREEHLEFREALFLLADRYKVDSRINSSVNKPVKEFRDAAADEPEGEKKYELNEKLTKEELALLGPFVTQEVCDRYNYYSVKWYSTVKNRKVMTVHSTENYPIFLHDCGSFKKVYKPLEPEKQYRFFCIGEKPERYINGLDVLKKLHEDYVRNMDSDREVEEARGDDEEKPRRKSEKLPEAIICSGERDALNCAGMGYPALWLNSETAKLEPGEYAEIMKRVDTLYNVPDNDDTGVAKGRELAKKYIDIRTVELPAWLGRFKDNRGRPAQRTDFMQKTIGSKVPQHTDPCTEQNQERGQKRIQQHHEDHGTNDHCSQHAGRLFLSDNGTHIGKDTRQTRNKTLFSCNPAHILHSRQRFFRGGRLFKKDSTETGIPVFNQLLDGIGKHGCRQDSLCQTGIAEHASDMLHFFQLFLELLFLTLREAFRHHQGYCSFPEFPHQDFLPSLGFRSKRKIGDQIIRDLLRCYAEARRDQ